MLIDQSSFSKFEIDGPGSLDFLNRLAANNIDKPVGNVIYTQLCNDRGGIECDITIARIAEDRFFIISGTAFGVHDAVWIKKHMPNNGSVRLRDVTSAYGMINICGPNSRKLLEKVSEDDVSNEHFKFGQCRQIRVGYASALVLRITYVGELGYELYVPPEYQGLVYELLWEAGQEFGVANAGYRAIESLRLEKGYRAWGSDITPDYTPFDAGLGFCVATDKGNFIGCKALHKIKKEAPKWNLCCFTLDIDSPKLLRGGEPICLNGKVHGVVTSGGYGHTVGKTIAYGYLSPEHAHYEDGYEIEVYGEVFSATRHDRTLYDPEREKILR